VLFQQREKFLVKAHFSVMRFLIPYVSNDSRYNRGAHAKCPVALLPRKLLAPPFDQRDEFDLIVETALANAKVDGI
jgi:hypothetical protein